MSSNGHSDPSIGESVAAVIVVVIVCAVFLIYLHQTHPELRAALIFGRDVFIGLFTAVGVLVAAVTFMRSAQANRAAITLRFLERWNDPNITVLKDKWHNLYYSLRNKSAVEILQKMIGDDDAQTTATAILSFFEEFAFAVNARAADSGIARRLLGETIRDYYLQILPWIKYRRTSRPDAWMEIHTMLTGWYPDHSGDSDGKRHHSELASA